MNSKKKQKAISLSSNESFDLTDREKKILQSMVEGSSCKMIAITYFISIDTDRTYNICFDCIKTLPSQSEIRVSYFGINGPVEKTIDIVYTTNNKMVFHNMHE